ncbi:MarR family transcriptional regulator [Nocardiopsis sp. CNR-923]|uniref:MarR family winged helix-turn-helix transcriptional regulator n=1 Tax=Nocardiopsis sp. CNR-923 TaxID=1904965 RepID=UPI00096215EB|nr:MarR family transcriptional regulator [Nocardiopsis sp. CNR-923]OLT25025.1 MarR family transcriptional regulator [Nocardiopsis sp. CNR-923]
MTQLPMDQRIGHHLKRAEQELIAAKHAVLRQFNLSVPQYTVLLVLSEEPGLSGAILARRCLVTPQTMSSVLATLSRRELIERKPHPLHSHILETRLSETGHALLTRADEAAVRVEARLSHAFTKAEEEEFVRYLARCAEASAEARTELVDLNER